LATSCELLKINQKPKSLVVAKWGAAAEAGFQLLPDVLLKQQSNLGLTAADLIVLINFTMHCWYPEQKPFPSFQNNCAADGY